jgi:hypothetical protein
MRVRERARLFGAAASVNAGRKMNDDQDDPILTVDEASYELQQFLSKSCPDFRGVVFNETALAGTRESRHWRE